MKISISRREAPCSRANTSQDARLCLVLGARRRRTVTLLVVEVVVVVVVVGIVLVIVRAWIKSELMDI